MLRSKIRRISSSLLFMLLVSAFIVSSQIQPTQATVAKSAFKKGDVVTANLMGSVTNFHGTREQSTPIMTGLGEVSDLTFDHKDKGDLFIVEFTNKVIDQFSNDGAFLGTFGMSPGATLSPESIDFDDRDNTYVGWVPSAGPGTGADGKLQKYNAAGLLLTTWTPAHENRGVDFLTLSNRCTVLYTSEGPSILAFDVCTGAQLPNFASIAGAPGAGPKAFGIRAEKNGDILVATLSNIVRFNKFGAFKQSYDLPGSQVWITVSLSKKGDRFWAVDVLSGDIVEFKEKGNGAETKTILNACPGASPCPGDIIAVAVYDEKDDPKLK